MIGFYQVSNISNYLFFIILKVMLNIQNSHFLVESRSGHGRQLYPQFVLEKLILILIPATCRFLWKTLTTTSRLILFLSRILSWFLINYFKVQFHWNLYYLFYFTLITFQPKLITSIKKSLNQKEISIIYL